MSDYPTDASETTFGSGRRMGAASRSSAALDDVFDDPNHGEPGRDRMGIHVAWELLLLLGAGAVGFLLWSRHPDLLRGQELRTLFVDIAALGVVTLGAGFSLRANVPNVAVGPVAIAAAIFFAEKGDQGVLASTGKAVVIASAVGVALAVLVVGFHVPGWAGSLVLAFVAIVYIQQRSGAVAVSGGYNPTRHAYYLVGGFAALAALAGLFGSIRTVRRAVGRFRPVSDPARRRGGVAGVLAALALILSTALAAVGGVLTAANSPEVIPTTGLELTGLALGSALLGGTSAFGRRGGIFGTLLAVVLVTLFLRYQEAEEWRISTYAIAATVVCAGLIVTRLVETLGRPQPTWEGDETDDGWGSSGETQPMTGSSWSSQRQDSWSSSLPAQPSSGGTSDLWDGRWGSRSTL